MNGSLNNNGTSINVELSWKRRRQSWLESGASVGESVINARLDMANDGSKSQRLAAARGPHGCK
jgi:hypothetical protein